MTNFLSDANFVMQPLLISLLCSFTITGEVEYELEVAEKASWDLAKKVNKFGL
jgi:hypothetical protein